MLIHTSLALRGSDSRDWSRPRQNWRDIFGCMEAVCFPIKLPVRYQVGGESGWGKTQNISSARVLFTTDRALLVDARAEVYIKWPILLHNEVPISLIASGSIILAGLGQAALAIEKYEFRTCIPSFFQCAQSWPPPVHATPDRQSLSGSQMARRQVVARERQLQPRLIEAP